MQSTITYKLSIYLRLKRIRMKIETSTVEINLLRRAKGILREVS